MNAPLTLLQQENLKVLGLDIGPNVLWQVRLRNGSEIQRSTLDWTRYSLSTERKLLAQRLILLWWTPAVAKGKAILSEQKYRMADILIRLLALSQTQHKDRAICELGREEWTQIAMAMVFHVWEIAENGQRQLKMLEKPLARQIIERTVSVIRGFFQAYQAGFLSDGPEYNVSHTDIIKVLRPELEAKNLDISDWKTGNTFGSIPFVVAHLLLSDAIVVMRSHRALQLLAFFRLVRNCDAYDLLPTFWTTSPKTRCGRYRVLSEEKHLNLTREGSYNGCLANRCKTEFALPLHNELFALHKVEHAQLRKDQPFVFPWRNYADFRKDYNELRSAIYIIFLTVMGKRGPSEVRTLRGIDITPSGVKSGQDATMRPSIAKTHQGLRVEQGVTNYIDEAFRTICCLSYIDKTETKLPLFSTLPTISKARLQPKKLSIWSASNSLHEYYDSFCGRIETKVDFDIKAHHERIVSHQFRHSFAEFALRRFDGNVEELFRQHALHSCNHWWTKRYTGDKLDEDELMRINRAYITELVPRVLHDSDIDSDFVGAMALYIKNNLGEHISVMNVDEAETYIERFCDDFVQVTAHEYGWCLLHKSFEYAAQCKELNGKPNPKGTSWEKCGGCSNFAASRKSHLDVHTQILISHVDFIEQNTFSMPRLKRASRQAIKNATKIFPELLPLANIE